MLKEVVDHLRSDFRYALRVLRSDLAFTLLATLAIAIGIGASTTIFSIVDAALLRPLPFPDSQRLVALFETLPCCKDGNIAPADFLDWRQQTKTFEGIAAYISGRTLDLTGRSEPVRLRGAIVSSNFFNVMEVMPRIGRNFSPVTDASRQELAAVIISSRLWHELFNGDPGALGQTLTLNGDRLAIIGVMPPGFTFPEDPDLWVQAKYDIPGANGDEVRDRDNRWIDAVGRLKEGITLSRARSELETISRRLQAEYPATNTNRGVNLMLLQTKLAGNIRDALWILFGAAALVLLVSCANVANLFLVRGTGRRKETAIRSAVGADRSRLVQQFLTEGVVLSLLGGAAGIALSKWALSSLRILGNSYLPAVADPRIDVRVLLFTFVLSIFIGIAFGLLPAFTGSRTDLSSLLQQGGRSSRSTAGIASTFVVAEIALSVILVTGAGLLTRSFINVVSVHPGFRADGVLTVQLLLPPSRYKTDSQHIVFYDRLLERLEHVPEIGSVGLIDALPISGDTTSGSVQIEGQPRSPGHELIVEKRVTSPGYFRSMGIDLRHGRFFTARDTANSTPVVIVSESLARTVWPNQDAIGKRFRWKDDESNPREVIGVVANVRQISLTEPPALDTYVPYTQAIENAMTLVMRSNGDLNAIIPRIRTAIREIDPDQAVGRFHRMTEILSNSAGNRRFDMFLANTLAVFALILAGVGVNSVVAYSVAQRTSEMALRMALGADRSAIATLVLSRVVALLGLGSAIGIITCIVLMRFASALLYGISATDILTFVAGVAVLVLTTCIASWPPIIRATRADPAACLRNV